MIYYVQYLLVVTLIMTNFAGIIDLTRTTIQNLIGFMNSLVPILITLLITTGSIATANTMQPIILFAIQFIGNFILVFILPAIMISTVLGIVSNISDKVQIGRLSKYFKSSIVWVLRSSAYLVCRTFVNRRNAKQQCRWYHCQNHKSSCI